MPTLAQLKAKIEADLHRTDLGTHVADAIHNSVRKYGRERFWFLEGTATITLAASTPSYQLPSDFKQVDSFLFNDTGGSYALDQVSYQELDAFDSGVNTGNKPSVFAIYGDKVRLYPVPNGTYSTTMSYLKGMDEPTSDSASNAWTSAAFDLIRYSAEKEIYASNLRNAEMAGIARELESEAFSSLIRENVGRISTGRLRKSGF